jgi:hypothetical protein
MNRYEMKTPRTAFGIAAVAMAVLTLGATVVIPMMTSPTGQETVAAVKNAAPRTEVAINPSHIEVVGVRPQAVASANKPSRIDLVSARLHELVRPQ